MKLSLQLTSFSLALFALSAPSLAQAQTDNPFGEIELPPAQPGQQGAQPAPQAQAQAQAPNAPQPPAPAMAPPPQQSAPPSSYNNNANSFELNGSGNTYGNHDGGAEASPQDPPKRSGLVFVPRLGFLLTGHANMHSDITCPDAYLAASPFRPPVGGASSDDPFCNPLIAGAPEQDGSATDNSSILVGADLLYHVAPMLRIGGSALWTPATQVSKPDVLPPFRMGADVSLDLTLEHLYADNGSSALLYRVMAGPSLLLTGGDLENNQTAEKKVCRDLFKVCEFGSGVYPGYNLGAGLGALIPVGGSSLRTDLLLNYVAVPFRSTSATVENQNTGRTFDASIDEDISFVRLWLSVGTEM